MATEDEMIGWHHQLNGHEFEQALGDGEGQGSLTCHVSMGSQRVRHDLTTELQQQTAGQTPQGQEEGHRNKPSLPSLLASPGPGALECRPPWHWEGVEVGRDGPALEQWRGCPGPLFKMFFYEPNQEWQFSWRRCSPSKQKQNVLNLACVFLWQSVKNLPAKAGDRGSVSKSGRSPGEGNGNLLQYSSLVHPKDRGAWWATVHGVARLRHDLATKPPAPRVLVVQNPRATCDRE